MNCYKSFFRADAYTESDNALCLKKRSGNARLLYITSKMEHFSLKLVCHMCVEVF